MTSFYQWKTNENVISWHWLPLIQRHFMSLSFSNLKLIHHFIGLFYISIWFFILCASTKLIFSNSNEQTVMLKTGSVLSRYFPTKHDVNIEK